MVSLDSSASSGQSVKGSLASPQHWSTSDARTFSRIHGEIRTKPIVASSCQGNGALSFTVQNPSDASDRDSFVFTLKDKTHAELQLTGTPLPPMKLMRVEGTYVIATDWDETKSYSPDDDLPSNPEMKRIFDEDQRVRAHWQTADMGSVARTDAERREATTKLLNDDALRTGGDFYRAAFVFQHGAKPDDYLLAHTLAMTALKKGYGDALWIASATLDRYLQSIHQPQIYGTQFLFPKDKPTTQEPYNRELLSDSLRRQLGVGAMADQEKQRKQYDVQRGMDH